MESAPQNVSRRQFGPSDRCLAGSGRESSTGVSAALIEACAELGGVNWEWQAADGAMGKARLGGDCIGKSPTDRGKVGVKRSLLVEASGGPLGVMVAGANVHDTKCWSLPWRR
jgi:hypothetical protein